MFFFYYIFFLNFLWGGGVVEDDVLVDQVILLHLLSITIFSVNLVYTLSMKTSLNVYIYELIGRSD